MIDSLRRIGMALIGVSALGVIGSFSMSFLSCSSFVCGAAAFLSQDSTVPAILAPSAAAADLFWGTAIYLFWIGALLLLSLELTKPHFLKKYFKRSKRVRS